MTGHERLQNKHDRLMGYSIRTLGIATSLTTCSALMDKLKDSGLNLSDKDAKGLADDIGEVFDVLDSAIDILSAILDYLFELKKEAANAAQGHETHV